MPTQCTDTKGGKESLTLKKAEYYSKSSGNTISTLLLTIIRFHTSSNVVLQQVHPGSQNHGGGAPHGEKNGYKQHTWQLLNVNQRDNYSLPRERKYFQEGALVHPAKEANSGQGEGLTNIKGTNQ